VLDLESIFLSSASALALLAIGTSVRRWPLGSLDRTNLSVVSKQLQIFMVRASGWPHIWPHRSDFLFSR
jgi:hypothetical protein